MQLYLLAIKFPHYFVFKAYFAVLIFNNVFLTVNYILVHHLGHVCRWVLAVKILNLIQLWLLLLLLHLLVLIAIASINFILFI